MQAPPEPEIIRVQPGRDDGLIRRFYEKLYLPAFPHPEHREDLEALRQTMAADPATAPCYSVWLMAGHNLRNGARPDIWGGVVFELYRESECGLLAYIVVAPRRR